MVERSIVYVLRNEMDRPFRHSRRKNRFSYSEGRNARHKVCPTRGDTNKTVGGSNLNLINAKSRDDCIHKGRGV